MQVLKTTAHAAVLHYVQTQILGVHPQDTNAQKLLFELEEYARHFSAFSKEEVEGGNRHAFACWQNMGKVLLQLKRHGCNLKAYNLEEVIPAFLKMRNGAKIQIIQREPFPTPTQIKIPKPAEKNPDIWERTARVFGKRN